MLLNARKNEIDMIDEVVNPCQKGTQLLQGMSCVSCTELQLLHMTMEWRA